jgi:integrase
MQIDDDIRWLVALVSDTGMRLAEAAGLSISDFNLQGDIPFVEVRKHPWRSLKTSASARVIPLSGMALWAAQKYCNKRIHRLMPSLDTIVDHVPVQIRRVLQLTSG